MRLTVGLFVLIATAAGGACVGGLPGGSLNEPTGSGTDGIAVTGAGAGGGATPPPVFQTLVLDGDTPRNIAVDSTNVYWITRQPPYTLMKAPIAGGSPSPLQSIRSFFATVGADGQSVYWSDAPDGTTVTDIFKMPPAGGEPTQVAKGADAIIRFAVGRNGVYWTTSAGTVMKVGLVGGSPMVLATGQLKAGEIAVDATNVYWVREGYTIMMVGVSGGEPVQITKAPDGLPVSLAIDATYAYWIIANGAVMRASLADGRAETVFPSARATSLAVDASGIYWTDSGRVFVGQPGSPTDVRVVGEGEGGISSGVILDASSVYWIGGELGSIFRAPK